MAQHTSPATTPSRAVRLRNTCGVLLLGSRLLTSGASAAEAGVSVTVLAQPRFDELGHGARGGGGLELRARLLDDAGHPLPGVKVNVGGRGTLPELVLASCEQNAASPRRARGTLTQVLTDSTGRLCVLVLGASPRGAVELTFRGDTLHLPARAELALQPARSEARLAFGAPSLELDLEQPIQRLELTLTGADPGEPLPYVALALHDGGSEIELNATEWVRSGDTLSFSLASDQLGSPGPARLVARYAGSDILAPARAEAVALRVAPVRLHAEIISLDEAGATLRVSADTPAGAPTSGWVEVSSGGEPVTSSPFVAGLAELRLPSAAIHSGSITLSYRADDPWWRPGEPLELRLEQPAVTAPIRWPWLVLLAPVGYVCLRSLQRPAVRKAERRRPPARRSGVPPSSPHAPASGWVGTVLDAHEGSPIAGARVEALLPSLRAASAGFVALTDLHGNFQLPAHQDPLPEGARLRVSAPLHTEVERPLPPQGRVDVTLVSRRRALLRRLVRWARSVGPPWARGGEPTPAEIVDVALRRGDTRTAQWAERVEAVAFGDAPVDHAIEATLRAQEPPWQHGGQPREEQHDEE